MFKPLAIKINSRLRVFISIILISVFFIVIIFPVNSKTLDEIEQEIKDKESELESLEVQLQEAKDLALYYESQKGSTASELEKIENELNQVETEIQINEAEIEKLEQSLELKNLELEYQSMQMSGKLLDLYIHDRKGVVDTFLPQGDFDGLWKDVQYRESLLGVNLGSINEISTDIESLESEKGNVEKSIAFLGEENDRLGDLKKDLESQIAYYSSLAAYNTNKQGGIRAQMGGVQQAIDGLTEEQKKMMDEEMQLIKNANGGTQPLVSGEYYFYGRGRASYQGHGLGFSQYGAKGGGLAGMNADSIAKFYYQGSYIETTTGTVNVIGYGVMDIEDYASGLGEVPDYACGTQEQQNERSDKYRVPNPNLWENGCWPEEAIKAQVIVARSYALAYGKAICTTATCQVYKGGNNKRWAAEETAGKVLKVDGSIIKAYYSSDNHNGWGSATHRNPVWCGDFHGNCGAGFSWLQAVNDSSFAAKGSYTDWMWRTNSYTLEEIQSMLEWYANQGYTYPSSNDVRNLLNNVGSISDLAMQRDVSGRVAKISITGSLGSENVNGGFFKMIWNFWVGNTTPSGEVDPIFSLTYHFRQVP